MANSITGINDDIIAQGAIEAFTASVLPLTSMVTNFSADAAKRGEKVSILRTIAADAATTKVSHTAYTIQDADSDAIELTLGQPVYVSFGLDDVEIASSSVLNMDVYGKQKGFQLAKKVLQDVLSEITAANFGAAGFTGAAANFDEDDVADIASQMDQADIPEDGRVLVLKPAYFTSLLKSTGIKDASAFGGAEAIRQGNIPNLSGFAIFKSNLIPANGENLVGFASHMTSLAFAMRYLQPQEGNTYLRAEPFTDPNGSGVTLGLRDWYENSTGIRNRVFECVYAWETAQDGIQRLVSA